MTEEHLAENFVPYDAIYKKIFSIPQMAESVVVSVAPKDFVRELDFSSMQLVPSESVSSTLRRSRRDLVWTIPWKGREQLCHVYLFLEFQHSHEREMALRFLGYLVESMGNFILPLLHREKGRGEKLVFPPMLPIVLYNGKEKWSSPTRLRELIAPVNDFLAPFQPDMNFLLVDMSHMPEEERNSLHALLALLAREEQLKSTEDARELVADMGRTLTEPWAGEILRTMLQYLGYALQKAGITATVPELHTTAEATMLLENAAHWGDKYREEGREEMRKENEALRKEAKAARNDAQAARDDAQAARNDAQAARNDARNARTEAQTVRAATQREERLSFAGKLLGRKFSLEDIMDMTGLSRGEIQNLAFAK